MPTYALLGIAVILRATITPRPTCAFLWRVTITLVNGVVRQVIAEIVVAHAGGISVLALGWQTLVAINSIAHSGVGHILESVSPGDSHPGFVAASWFILCWILNTRAARGLLNWSADKLAKACGLSLGTIQNAEKFDGMPNMQAKNLHAVKTALERGGVEFTNDDQPGVKMKRKGRK